MAVGETLVKHL